MTDSEATKQTGEWRRPKVAPCSMVQSPLVDYMWGIDDTRSASRDRRLHAAARALCGVCPLKDKCLALAVVQRMKNAGIMGGLNDTERRYVAHLAQSQGIEVTAGRGRWLLTDEERRILMSNFMQWLQAHPDAIETSRKMASRKRELHRRRETGRDGQGSMSQPGLFEY